MPDGEWFITDANRARIDSLIKLIPFAAMPQATRGSLARLRLSGKRPECPSILKGESAESCSEPLPSIASMRRVAPVILAKCSDFR